MALKSWLASLKADVSNVSPVQAPINAGLGRYVTETADVSGASGSSGIVAVDTADTAGNMQTYQAQPAWALACTGDTADTCKKINTEAHAANELLYGGLLTGWKVTIPDGVSAATLAKFRAASLALDASIVAAGVLPRNDADAHCWPHSTAMNGAEIDAFMARAHRFTDKGLTLDHAEALADKLVIRDREQDARRVCLECSHCSGSKSWRCGNWAEAGVAASAFGAGLGRDLAIQLQHCPGFREATWVR